MTRETITRAAELIRGGELVVFPTETVYGLGANALDEQAVEKIYAAKRRPATSPLIVHVSDVAMARELVAEWPDGADALAARFWPGPLTLVLPKKPVVPDRVTAGLASVGIRVPDHPVALELIRAAGVPIAGPSANEFTRLSPTAFGHVDLPGVAMVLDGGPARVGIESTVLSLVGGAPVLLRPGMVSRAAIEEVLGRPVAVAGGPGAGGHESPGMHERHYRPRAALRWWDGGDFEGVVLRVAEIGETPSEYARRLYAALHAADESGARAIALERPPSSPEWAAVQDRLRRAVTE